MTAESTSNSPVGNSVSRLDLVKQLCQSFAQVVTGSVASRSGVGGESGRPGGDVNGQVSPDGQLNDSEDESGSGTGSSIISLCGRFGGSNSRNQHPGHGEYGGKS